MSGRAGPSGQSEEGRRASETAAFLFITFAFCRSEKHLIFLFALGKKKLFLL